MNWHTLVLRWEYLKMWRPVDFHVWRTMDDTQRLIAKAYAVPPSLIFPDRTYNARCLICDVAMHRKFLRSAMCRNRQRCLSRFIFAAHGIPPLPERDRRSGRAAHNREDTHGR